MGLLRRLASGLGLGDHDTNSRATAEAEIKHTTVHTRLRQANRKLLVAEQRDRQPEAEKDTIIRGPEGTTPRYLMQQKRGGELVRQPATLQT